MNLVENIFSNLFGLNLTKITADIIRENKKEKLAARAKKEVLLKKLEKATGEDIFKLMNLISFANMDEFVAEARLHAQQSFKICMYSAISGFFVVCVSVGYAIYFQISGIESFSAVYLGSGVGLITEAIAAIFFSLYSKTTRQVNHLHDRLLGSQSAFSAILSTTLLTDQAQKQNQIVSLSDKLISRLEVLDNIKLD